MPTVPEDLAPQVTVGETIVYPISSLSVMYFIYGCYLLLFGTCVYMMSSRQQDNARHNHNLFLIVTFFVLSTFLVADYTIVKVNASMIHFNAVRTGDYEPLIKYLMHDVKKTVLLAFGELVPILLNITAEWMLIERCYYIWSSRKRIAMPMIAASVVVNALGFAGAIMLSVGFSDTRIESNYILYQHGGNLIFAYGISSGMLNSVLTLLTAGRIWWIHRRARAHGVHSTDNLLQSVPKIVLESGVLYPILQVANLVLVNAPVDVKFDFYPLATLSAGIAPTLIMVRAKLGKNVESLQDKVSDIRFTSRPAPGEGTSTIRTQAEIYSIGNITGSMIVPDTRENDETTNGKEIAPV